MSDYNRSIHTNPDAMAWTKFFRECNPDCNVPDDLMHGWFANAMMAMHDHLLSNKHSEKNKCEIVWDGCPPQIFPAVGYRVREENGVWIHELDLRTQNSSTDDK